jgi:hypothetical protein
MGIKGLTGLLTGQVYDAFSIYVLMLPMLVHSAIPEN